MIPTAYPYETWPSVSRQALRALRWASRIGAEIQRARGPAADALGLVAELCGSRPTVAPVAAPTRIDAECLGRPGPLVLLLLEHATGPVMLVELEPILAAHAVDRVLGGHGPSPLRAQLQPLDPLSCGVLAYLAARLLAALRLGYRLRAVLTEPQAAQTLLGPAPLVVTSLEIAWDGCSGCLRLWSRADAALKHEPTWTGRHDALRDLELTLIADAGGVQLPAREVRNLAVGDAVVPSACHVAPCAAGGWRGEVYLAIDGARATRWRGTAEDRRITIRHRDRRKEGTMSEGRRILPAETHAPQGLADDAPVELAVELARFTLPLGELAALSPGEVLLCGARIGERVTLRAGRRAVATGELVQVEGEVAVRILELAHQT